MGLVEALTAVSDGDFSLAQEELEAAQLSPDAAAIYECLTVCLPTALRQHELTNECFDTGVRYLKTTANDMQEHGTRKDVKRSYEPLQEVYTFVENTAVTLDTQLPAFFYDRKRQLEERLALLQKPSFRLYHMR